VEKEVSARIRIEAAKIGCVLWRNNVGALLDCNGRMIRYGLANDSKRMNAVLKSSDLIGIWVGRFVSIEAKAPGWRYRGDARETAQLNWINLINANGGLAGFATCWSDAMKILGVENVHATKYSA